MEILRTPDDRFADLAGWPYAPRYTEIDDGDGGRLRVHHVDEGPPDADPILCLHGEPTWGYLYRTMLEPLVAAGHRVVVPDLVGFGRSDKPAERTDYTYARHVGWMAAWLQALDLGHVTLFCQDWGGLIGLRLVAEHEARFDRVVASNTFLPTGDAPPSEAFLRWQQYSQTTPSFDVGRIVEGGCATRPLDPAVVAAYDAPFPDDSFKAGARQFPALVPTAPDDPAVPANRAAWEVLARWGKPFLTAFADNDPITAGGDRALQARIPGCAGQPHTTIDGAAHFVQEDRGPVLADVVAGFIAATPRSAR